MYNYLHKNLKNAKFYGGQKKTTEHFYRFERGVTYVAIEECTEKHSKMINLNIWVIKYSNTDFIINKKSIIDICIIKIVPEELICMHNSTAFHEQKSHLFI